MDINPFKTEDLIDLQPDFSMKALFKETQCTEFRMHQLNVPEHRSIAKKAISVVIQMPTTYLCESVFYSLCMIKSHKRNPITQINTLMKVALQKDIIPPFRMLVDSNATAKSHQR